MTTQTEREVLAAEVKRLASDVANKSRTSGICSGAGDMEGAHSLNVAAGLALRSLCGHADALVSAPADAPVSAEREALAEECKRLAEWMADKACASEAGDFVAKERLALHAAINRLASAPADAVPVQPDFETWWAEHGQYCRAGGGDYEKTFAFRAWEAARNAVPAPAETPTHVTPEPVAWAAHRSNGVIAQTTHYEAEAKNWTSNGGDVRPLGYITPAPADASLRENRLAEAMTRMDKLGPLPGMISAFENQFGQAWTDREWRQEASIWAAAWRAAMSQADASQAEDAARLDWLESENKIRIGRDRYSGDGVVFDEAFDRLLTRDTLREAIDAARKESEK